MTDYFGGQTSYSYDALGRLTSLTNPFGEVTTFQYDANSRLIRKNLANGTYTTYSYNSRGFLAGVYNYKSNGTLLTYATYTYDAVGNGLSMSTPEGNYSYSYDAIYRLTGEVNPVGGTYSYTYDAVGNRLSMTRNGQTINYVYDAGNKLLQAGNTTFTYDGNGNMVSKTENGQTTTYVYNYEDKMVQVNLPNGSSVVYSYDHSGKRIAKTAGGVTIDYYFDGDDLITEAQGANILAYYSQGQGLISQRRNNASYFYHYDGLGSTKALTDASQNIQSSTIYDTWGNVLQASGTIINPVLYFGAFSYYGEQINGTAVYSSSSIFGEGDVFYFPCIARSTKKPKPPLPIDWIKGGYGKWPDWPGENPAALPTFKYPANCQQKTWNMYIACLIDKMRACINGCIPYVGGVNKPVLPYEQYSVPTPPYREPFPPSGVTPPPTIPLEVIAKWFAEWLKSIPMRNCLIKCMNGRGWNYYAPAFAEAGQDPFMWEELPDCFGNARRFYQECCEKEKIKK